MLVETARIQNVSQHKNQNRITLLYNINTTEQSKILQKRPEPAATARLDAAVRNKKTAKAKLYRTKNWKHPIAAGGVGRSLGLGA